MDNLKHNMKKIPFFCGGEFVITPAMEPLLCLLLREAGDRTDIKDWHYTVPVKDDISEFMHKVPARSSDTGMIW
jgi:hypothetical protein